MKKITPEEASQFTTRPMKRQGHLRTVLMNMKVNEILHIEPKDWTWTTATPAYLCRRVEEKTKWKFECRKIVGSPGGWLVQRIK